MIEYVTVRDPADPLFDAALEIYAESFPARERHPETVIRERVAAGRSRLIVGLENGATVLLAMLWDLRNSGFVLLDYLAVSPARRGRGLGGRFLRDLLANGLDGKRLIAEVEDPASGKDRPARQRRVEFYRRYEFGTLNGVRYRLPALQGQGPTEMLLMVGPAASGEILDGHVVRELIVRIYHELYGRGLDDQLLQSFIDHIPRVVALTA